MFRNAHDGLLNTLDEFKAEVFLFRFVEIEGLCNIGFRERCKANRMDQGCG